MSALDPIHTIVVDLEATCWSAEEDPKLHALQSEASEIIEIGAVALDADLRPLREFQQFVRPVRHPRLSDFCTHLTSITQADVDGAGLFADVYAAFVSWMGGHTADLRFVSWSRYDHRQLVRECRLNDLERPAWHPIDAKQEFTEWARAHTGLRLRYGLARALEYLNIPFSGTAHRGIDDARNLVLVFQHLRSLDHLSPNGRIALKVLHRRDPQPSHVGHVRRTHPEARRWFPIVKRELIRHALATDLGLGRGLVLTERGRDVVASGRLDRDVSSSPHGEE